MIMMIIQYLFYTTFGQYCGRYCSNINPILLASCDDDDDDVDKTPRITTPQTFAPGGHYPRIFTLPGKNPL